MYLLSIKMDDKTASEVKPNHLDRPLVAGSIETGTSDFMMLRQSPNTQNKDYHSASKTLEKDHF